ncbi:MULTISPECIES: hypothetical protein [unclassified Pseudomonas]|uniref:hypothetical protein n=1 Tax=unclassified Pseudomonas TaxID=196821 RepID=UPI0006F7C83F|nr:hypothetical protein [Pseudomonas sp. Leaf434]KQT65292.1 hypothetical protein ASG55_12695 [Pseudomonas sp. Leaf434]
MTEEAPNFGAIDLAGPKFASPNQTNDAESRLIDESIRRKTYSRYFATWALVFLTIAAACCLSFSMWVGKHFLDGLDDQKNKEIAIAAAQAAVPPVAALTSEKKNTKAKTSPIKEDRTPPSAEANKETFYVKILAPLIPASFSSAIAIILFITIARLVTNFEKMGRENPEKDHTEDYGTLAAFFQELVKLIKSFKKE